MITREIHGSRTRAPATIERRRRALRPWWDYMAERELTDQSVTWEDIQLYVDERLDEGRSPNTIANVDKPQLRKWLASIGRSDLILQWNERIEWPASYLDPPTALLPAQDWQAMRTAKRTTAWVVYALCRFAGLRVDEAIQLEWKDVEMRRGGWWIHIQENSRTGWTPKNHAGRTIPVYSALQEVLEQEYQDMRETHSYREVCLRWCVGELDTLGPWRRAPFHQWRDIQAAADIPKGVGWHILRRTYATRLRQAGVDLDLIMRWLGHRNIQTTMRYIDHSQVGDHGHIEAVGIPPFNPKEAP